MVQNKNGQYWSNRFTKLEETLNGYGQDTYRQIEPAFNQAQREIQSKIDSWVVRVANNNQMSIQEAKKLLDAKELAEFQWDVQEFIKYGHDNALDAGWMKELENASARYHISRLEALKIRTQQAAEKAFGNELDELDTMARKVYSDGYYHTAYELQKGFSVGWDIASIDSRKLERLISKPWAADGKNFSNRIWQSKASMVNELHNELVRTCILGKSPDEAIRHMTKFVDKKFKNAKMQAGRLVMTEQAFFASAAQKDAFTDLDVEEFEVVATLDSHTSEICQAMDGQHFPMRDYEPGVTAPPFHVWCRSTTVPYFDDEFNIGERAARDDKTGQTYYVPDSMKYPEWKQTFVDGGSKVKLKPIGKSATMKMKTIDECTTVSELNAVVSNELMKFGYVKVDFNGIDFELAKRNASQLINLQSKFNNHINCIQIDNCGKGVYAHVVRVGNDQTCIMELSPPFYKSVEKMEKSYLEDLKSFYHPVGTEKYADVAVLTHEFGHTFSNATQNKLYDYDDEFWKEIKSIKNKYTRAMTALDKKWIVTKELSYDEFCIERDRIYISSYAKKNLDEFLAEGFCMAELSDTPSPFATQIYECVKKYFGKDD